MKKEELEKLSTDELIDKLPDQCELIKDGMTWGFWDESQDEFICEQLKDESYRDFLIRFLVGESTIEGDKLTSFDNEGFGYVDKNGQNIPCGGYYRRYNYLYQTYWSNVEFSYKGKIVARLSDNDKATWLKEVASCGFVLVSDGQSELVVNPEIV